MRRVRKIPLRTCVGCGESTDKRQLVRVVRDADGHVTVDSTGKAPGRGAYVCGEPDCFETAVKKHKIDRALRVSLKPDDLDRLLREFRETVTTSNT